MQDVLNKVKFNDKPDAEKYAPGKIASTLKHIVLISGIHDKDTCSKDVMAKFLFNNIIDRFIQSHDADLKAKFRELVLQQWDSENLWIKTEIVDIKNRIKGQEKMRI